MRVCLHWRQDGNVAAVQRDESKAHLCDLWVLLSKINESRVSHWKCHGWFRVSVWSVDRLIKKKFLNWPAVCKHQFYNSCLSLMCVHCFTSLTQFSPSNNLLSCLHVSTVDAVKWGVTNKASCVCFHPNKRLLASLTWKPCGLGAPLAFSCALKERLMCNQNHKGAVFQSPSGQGLWCGESAKKLQGVCLIFV